MSSSFQSQKRTADSLTLRERLDLVPGVLTILANAIAAVFTGAFRNKQTGGRSLYSYICLTAIRTATRRLSPRQQHYMFPNTDSAYEEVCKARKVTPQSEVLEDGTKAHWIGDKKADKLIINFHGGGYVMPAGPGMIEFMFRIVDMLSAQGKSVAVLFLAYDLAPGALYPRPLQQACGLLNHVLNTLSISPENIILIGDSAGANLALQLLSHISHPWNETHPASSSPVAVKGGIPTVKPSAPFRGVVLASPWTSFSLSEKSFKTNAYTDCICVPAGMQWSEAFMGSPHPHAANSDYYNQPITAPASWWKDLMVDDMLIVAGGAEVLIDGIKKFAGIVEQGFGESHLEVFIAPGEYHDQASVDIDFGYQEDGAQAAKIKSWMGTKF
ncbi:hypothetical protein BP6252_01495 [Coleophoma cylindrospora]|uniref:Alpha/beta hydrolase fold-3 domain-containing protein n=1 Tax=Coleophoma cylindrospora TaxID=1849047 RepID=A0A3D8ST07_9HELO|nr:hypothetical protein BP6252_01495 [Coleophoma cylindrospora]